VLDGFYSAVMAKGIVKCTSFPHIARFTDHRGIPLIETVQAQFFILIDYCLNTMRNV